MSSRAPFTLAARSARLLRATENTPHTIPMGNQKNRQFPTEKKTEGAPLTIIVGGMVLLGGYFAWQKWNRDPAMRRKTEETDMSSVKPATPAAAPRAKD
ncbi:hypothetical protein DFQ27_004880 [Actinomortierella ambigua]|uniref:Uncharacterized protein n=1 Tax=Actinomortierella ambigua TaxID=1343610 RepID=A0A9P6Q352_9FUNG|nr:hypothetical protein DFQ27_004880 [Actinomortierella ambigua]